MEPPRYSVGCCVNKRDELLRMSWLACRGGSSVKWNERNENTGACKKAGRERQARIQSTPPRDSSHRHAFTCHSSIIDIETCSKNKLQRPHSPGTNPPNHGRRTPPLPHASHRRTPHHALPPPAGLRLGRRPQTHHRPLPQSRSRRRRQKARASNRLRPNRSPARSNQRPSTARNRAPHPRSQFRQHARCQHFHPEEGTWRWRCYEGGQDV